MTHKQHVQPTSSQSLTQQAEDDIYRQGIKQGVLTYLQIHQGKAVSGRQVYDFLMTMLLDTTHPSLWNAGYLPHGLDESLSSRLSLETQPACRDAT